MGTPVERVHIFMNSRKHVKHTGTRQTKPSKKTEWLLIETLKCF